MELRQLRYFLAVADARSFVAAAEKQFVSRQAISKSVAQLEEELNVELFMRDSGGAFLTPAGMMFYERIRTLVMELDSVRSQMQSYGNRYQQRIRIAFAVGTVQLVEETLITYRENQHNAEITYDEYSEDICLRMLTEHQADVIVTTASVQDPLFVTKELLHSPFGILIKEQQELQDVEVKDLSWIPLAGQHDCQTEDFCKRNQISLRFRGYDTRRLLELTAAGKCAMLLPKCLVPKWMKDVRWLPIQDGGDWKLYTVCARNTGKNLMFSDALSELNKNVFVPLGEKQEDAL